MPKKILFLLLLLCLAPVLIYFSLAAKYKYNVQQDYQYAINKSEHIEISTQIQQGKFTFSSTHQPWDTAFIKLTVKSTLTGYFAEPFVEIISHQKSSILTFERGVSGDRYINLPANTSQQNSITLVGHHLNIEDQTANIVLFNHPTLHKEIKVLVISPHPDDAEIAAFNLYSQHNSVIVTLTAGEAGPHTYDEIYPKKKKHYQAKGKLRVWNSITTPMLGQIPPESAINLGYFDGTLQQMFQHKNKAVSSLYSGITNINHFRQQNISTLTPKSNGIATWNALITDLKHLLLQIQPDIIIAPYPAIDAHSDHKLSTIALVEAIQELHLTQGQLLLYTNHFHLNNYFPYGQQGELAPIPPDFNQSIYFDSIYSYSPPDYREKIFALDSMNDLRLDTDWLSISGAFKVFKNTLVNRLLFRDQTYFRKAVRENELFLSISISSLYKQDVIKHLLGTAH